MPGRLFALTLRAVQEQKRDPFLTPAFIPRGDGMKATIVISPLRREFWTFFGLYTAKGENGQKRRPINKNRNPPLSERVAFVSASFCRSTVLRQNTLRAPLVCPKYAGGRSEPQRIRRCPYEALKPLTGAKTGSIFAPRLYPSPPKCGRRFGFAENGDSRVSYFTAPKGALDILRTLRFTDFEADCSLSP